MALLAEGMDFGILGKKDLFQKVVYFRLACAKGPLVTGPVLHSFLTHWVHVHACFLDPLGQKHPFS